MSHEKVRGRCYCGRVEYEADLPSLWVGHCHCENCRRAHGAGFVTYAGFSATGVRFTAGEAELTDFHTETQAVRRFCRYCGSTISFQAPRWEGEVHLVVANLLDPLDKLPGGHAYSDRAPDWCPVTDALKRYGGPTGTEPL
jgi:hypothetical protein